METSNRSFLELINEFKINIPIIQRDYAQGREEEFEKREKFLSALFFHLTQSRTLDLDFIYGRINGNVFYPIDGQQRLTTLFLLHWYISIKENVDSDSRQVLTRFIYDTRISSREFCKSLIEEKINIPKDVQKNNFIIEIQNENWFRNSWKKDPTIKAMLVMIQAIHEIFNQTRDILIWDKLIKDRLITFEVLDLGAKGFELTDELYIKMNSRGKQLTSFENFKANFIQFIDRDFRHKTLKHPVKGEISYSGYFSYKIEKEWTDLFWAYRGNKSTIDVEFNNYFEFVAQLCFFKFNKEARAEDFKNTFTQYEEIFSKEDNLLFLFNSLDKLYQLFTNKAPSDKNNVDDIFGSLFTNVSPQNSINGEVTFFGNTGNLNLFERIIKEGRTEDARNKILFYGFLYYLISHDLSVTNDGLKKYIRVLRNLMQATRQRNDTKYNTNIRINNFGSYWLLFEQLATIDVYDTLHNQTLNNKSTQISDGSLGNEKIKAAIIFNKQAIANDLFALEELSCFGGLIHQLKPQSNYAGFKDFSNAIHGIWDNNISDTLRIQALIACNFEGISIRNTKMGSTSYFGKNGNWSTILTDDSDDISNTVLLLLNSYLLVKGSSVEARISSIINNWFANNTKDRSWKYYFLKYPTFTSKLNYYIKENDFEIRMLGTEGSNPLVAYHISAYVLTVCRLINDENICREGDCYKQYSGNSPLILKNGITLTCTNNGWVIETGKHVFPPNIITKYSLVKEANNFILKEPPNKDRIEIAVDFIKNLK